MNSVDALLVASAVLSTACAAQPEDRPVHTETSAGVLLDTAGCASIGWRSCIAEREAALMRVVPGVRRAGDTLELGIRGRSSAKFISTPDSIEVGHSYVYYGYLPALRSHLVEVQLYEGGGFVLVSAATGRLLELDDRPVIAPGGLRFATASWDTEAGYNPNRAQIYRLAGDSAVLEWQVEPSSWGPTDVLWINESTLTFHRQPGLGTDSLRLSGITTVRLTTSGWVADTLPDWVPK